MNKELNFSKIIIIILVAFIAFSFLTPNQPRTYSTGCIDIGLEFDDGSVFWSNDKETIGQQLSMIVKDPTSGKTVTKLNTAVYIFSMWELDVTDVTCDGLLTINVNGQPKKTEPFTYAFQTTDNSTSTLVYTSSISSATLMSWVGSSVGSHNIDFSTTVVLLGSSGGESTPTKEGSGTASWTYKISTTTTSGGGGLPTPPPDDTSPHPTPDPDYYLLSMVYPKSTQFSLIGEKR